MTDDTLRPLAVITGASSGIGRELAIKAAMRGYRLLLVSRNEYALRELERTLHTRVDYLALDLTKDGSVDRICSWLSEHDLVPAILINNAGFGAFGPAIQMDTGHLSRMIHLNVDALTILSIRLGRRMANHGGGRILNVASTAAFQPCPQMAVYGATKAYVLSFSEALGEELKGSGVTVTALCPGPTRTNFGVNAGLKADSPFDHWATDPENVARCGFNAMMRGEPVVVQGFLNKIGSVLARLAPRSIVTAFTNYLIKQMK